ncbi:MAG: CDP-diacylglycerol--serine O-phosphatidyltransferase [Thiotrichales bacterium]|nr:CDP-diacylglycerol--serine O-phosphatidyltransferase [Thiotrichales bacterium]
MTEADPEPRPRRRGIYLLPNLFTTAALFAGFYAIMAAIDGRFEAAAAAVFVAMVLDGADGRIARLTNTQSAFGAEYDSLSDVICFGLAPSLIVHQWVLAGMGKLGWVAAFFFTAATALRLARFNTQLGTTDKRYFQGLPCPAAGATLAALVWFATELEIRGEDIAIIAFGMAIALGGLMVSNVRFHSFKDFDLRGRVPFVTMFVVVVVFVLVSSDPPVALFLGTLGYAVSGPVLTLWNVRKRRAARRASAADAGDPPPDIGTG